MPTMIKNRAENSSIAPIQRNVPEREDIAAPIPIIAKSEAGDVSVVTRADWVSEVKQGEWTYQTYAAIPEDGHRYEVVEGVLYRMPAPEWIHQKIAKKIADYLESAIETPGLGEICMAPIDVNLNSGNTVQPDVLVLLNEHLDRVAGKKVVGAPDLVVEVASPSTARHDRLVKVPMYADAGVSEYWIVDPKKETIEVFALEGRFYRYLGIFHGPVLLKSRIIPDISAKAEQFFAKRLHAKEYENKQDPNVDDDLQPIMISNRVLKDAIVTPDQAQSEPCQSQL